MEIANESLCICGHEAQEHHRSWIPGGYQIIEECEYYGWNEHGGAMPDETTGRWIDHCQHFRLNREAESG